MGKKARIADNFVDALEKEHRYAVLTKPGRIQILVRPTPKRLRKRGKRGWRLYGIVDSRGDADQTLMETVRGAIRAEAEGTDEGAEKETSKAEPSSNAAKH